MLLPDFNLDYLETFMGILAVAVGIYISVSTRKKALRESDKAHNEAIESITRAAKNIVDANQNEMDHLRVGDHEHASYINYLLEGIFKLHVQIRAFEIDPVFHPLPIQIYNKKEPHK